jgi:uncharacterized membrane protein YgaE (UPF0421/DUF939 family)
MSFGKRLQEKNARFLAQCRSRTLLLYVFKCLLGMLVCHRFYVWFPGHQLYWSIVSVLLVLAPGHRDSVQLSLSRIWANSIGAAVGLAFFVVPLPEALSLCLAVIATIGVCHYLVLGGATRSALAALVIVFIQQNEARDWTVALERVGSVLLGCLVALALTLAFHAVEKRLGRKSPAKP